MTELSITNEELLNRAKTLNTLSEKSQVALGVYLVEIRRRGAFSAIHDTFSKYCQYELGRTKGDVSKLLKVGEFFLENGFHEETLPEVGYTKIYTALSVFPNKEPEYVIATAQENSIHEMLENKRSETHPNCNHQWKQARYCQTCGVYERV